MIDLKSIVELFCKISKTKQEAFVKGYLMGLGSYLACPIPHWKLMKKYPDSIDTEQEMREIFDEMHKKDIEEARQLLAEYRTTNR